MKFEFESYDEIKARLCVWKDWFAWCPVWLDDSDKPTLVWLQTIQRRKEAPYIRRWYYRLKPDNIDFEVHP